jgi:TPR repeat protein
MSSTQESQNYEGDKSSNEDTKSSDGEYTKSSDRGDIVISDDVDSMIKFGLMCQDNNGILVNQNKEKKLLKYASITGRTDIYYILGKAHAICDNHTKSIKYYEKGYEINCIKSIRELASIYRFGRFGTVDKMESISLYERAVELGDVRSNLELGKLHNCVIGAKDIDASISCFQKTCEMNIKNKKDEEIVGEAYYNLGRIYNREIKDEKKAIEYYKKGCELNYIGALRQLYDIYHKQKNYTETSKLAFEASTKDTHHFANYDNYDEMLRLYEYVNRIENIKKTIASAVAVGKCDADISLIVDSL